MEVAMEMEDDVFFADLNKQISLLIMDDDDDDPVARCPSVSLQAFSRAIHPAAAPQPSFSHNNQQTNCRREIKGTGVFIPQSSHPRRKNNRSQGNKFSSSSSPSSSSNNTKLHMRPHSVDNYSRSGIPPPSSNYMNNISSQNYPIIPKRC